MFTKQTNASLSEVSTIPAYVKSDTFHDSQSSSGTCVLPEMINHQILLCGTKAKFHVGDRSEDHKRRSSHISSDSSIHSYSQKLYQTWKPSSAFASTTEDRQAPENMTHLHSGDRWTLGGGSPSIPNTFKRSNTEPHLQRLLVSSNLNDAPAPTGARRASAAAIDGPARRRPLLRRASLACIAAGGGQLEEFSLGPGLPAATASPAPSCRLPAHCGVGPGPPTPEV